MRRLVPLLLLVALPAAAQFRQALPYEGFLEIDEVPAEGTFNLSFRILPAPGESSLATEDAQLTVVGGRFFHEIPLPPEAYLAPDLVLEIAVDGATLSGVQRIHDVPLAERARVAAGVDDDAFIDGNGGGLSFGADGSAGLAPQRWRLEGDALGMRVVDETNGGGVPLLIRPGAPSDSLTITSDGRVGIGTTAPGAPLTIDASANPQPPPDTLLLRNNGDARIAMENAAAGFTWVIDPRDDAFRISRAGSGTTEFLVDGSGNAAIAGNLNVAGTVRVQDVLVHPDFVFDDDYPLMDLHDLDAYVRANKHLPRVPSAADVKREGLDMTQMQLRLLEKVEELTLHTIRQQKEIDALRAALKDARAK